MALRTCREQFTMLLLGALLLAGLGLANAQSKNLTSAGCVDAAGFQKCQDAATTSTAACLAHANADLSQTEILACGCTNYVENYNCYASHCWNRVSYIYLVPRYYFNRNRSMNANTRRISLNILSAALPQNFLCHISQRRIMSQTPALAILETYS